MKRFLIATTAVLALSAPAAFASGIDNVPQFSNNHPELKIMHDQSVAVAADQAFKVKGTQVTENLANLSDETRAQRIEDQQSAAVARDVPASMLSAYSVTETAPQFHSNGLALRIMEQQSKAISG